MTYLKPIPPEFLLRKYESVEFIGEGADGHVYKCVRDGVTTAVKVLNSLDAMSRSRFAREVEILKRFDHEHIVKFLGAGETDGLTKNTRSKVRVSGRLIIAQR